MNEVELSRRNFLKAALSIPVGVAVGAACVPVCIELDHVTEEATGHPVGNASSNEEEAAACAKETDPTKCAADYQMPYQEKKYAAIIAPVFEETLFRAVPSIVTDLVSGEGDPISNVANGTEHFTGLTRTELIGGVASSILFGLSHNFTGRGLNKNTIPAAQTFGGFVLWGLQRRLGLRSNISAHATFNLIGNNLPSS